MKVYEKLNELNGTSLTLEEFMTYEICPTEFAERLGVSGSAQEELCMIAVRNCDGECDSLCISHFLNLEV